jgi:hypothetical protein
MKHDLNIPWGKYPIRLILDGVSLEPPPDLVPVCRAIRAYLEGLSMDQGRLLHTMTADGLPVNLAESGLHLPILRSVCATTMPFGEVPNQSLTMATDILQLLHARSEALALFVLINEWDRAEAGWWDLVPNLKEPLVLLGLWAEANHHGSASLAATKFWQPAHDLCRLGGIIATINRICQRRNVFELSDAIENLLLPWIEHLHASIEQARENTASSITGN